MNADSFLRAIDKAIAPLRRRVMLMVGRAVLTAVSDGGGLQKVQVVALDKETIADIERVQNFGFSSHPLPGATVMLLALGGNRNHAVAGAIDDGRHRPRNLLPGESIHYSAFGDYIRLKDGNIIEVVAAAQLTVNAPEVIITAATKVRAETPVFEVTGDIKDRCDLPEGKTMSSMRGTYNIHTHPENGAAGPTGAPNQGM